MFSDPNRVLVEITLSVSENYPKVRKRESLLAQTLNNFMQINVKALGHRKKLLSGLSRRAPHDMFTNSYRGLKLMAELLRI